MLKAAGAVFVLCACLGYAGRLLGQMGLRRDLLRSCLELTDLLAGEIRYERVPVAEALRRILERTRPEIAAVLGEIAAGLERGECETLGDLWTDSFWQAAPGLPFTQEEMEAIADIGRNLGFLDWDAQVAHLRGCRERLKGRLDSLQQELTQKRRLYRCLGLAAGIFVILILA